MTQTQRPATAHRESAIEGGLELGWLKLLFVTLGPAVAWGVHFLLSYFLIALGCTTGWQRTDAAIGVATVLLAVVTGLAGWMAFRNWRPRGEGGTRWESVVSDPGGRRNFLLLIGMMSAALFGLLIIMEGLSPVFLSTCAR